MRGFLRRNKILSIGVLLSVVIGLYFLNYHKPVKAVVDPVEVASPKPLSLFLLTGNETGFPFLERVTVEYLGARREFESLDFMGKHGFVNPPAFKSEEELDQFRRWQVVKDDASNSLEQSETKLESLIPVLNKWFLVVLKRNGGSENWAVGRFVHSDSDYSGVFGYEGGKTLEVKPWQELIDGKR